MSNAFYIDYSTGIKTLADFEGTYVNYTISDNLDIDLLIGDQSNRTSSQNQCFDPVPIVDDDNINNPNDGNTGSNGGGGTSGTGNTGGTGTGNTSETGGEGITICWWETIVICENHEPGGVCEDGPVEVQVMHCGDSFSTQSRIVNNDTIFGRSSTNDCPNDSGNIGVMDEEHIDNCNTLNRLLQVPSVKDQIEDIKHPNTVSNDNFTREKGFKVATNSSGALSASPIQTGAANGSFNYGPNTNIIVGVHSHHKGQFPMFTVDDILNLHRFYENTINSSVPISTSTAAHVLATNQGVYALKIEDLAKFAVYFGAFFGDPKELSKQQRKLEKEYNRFFNQVTGEQGNSSDHKLAFLRYAKNIGVSLYQADSDLNEWTKYDISDNNLDLLPNPCE